MNRSVGMTSSSSRTTLPSGPTTCTATIASAPSAALAHNHIRPPVPAADGLHAAADGVPRDGQDFAHGEARAEARRRDGAHHVDAGEVPTEHALAPQHVVAVRHHEDRHVPEL